MGTVEISQRFQIFPLHLPPCLRFGLKGREGKSTLSKKKWLTAALALIATIAAAAPTALADAPSPGDKQCRGATGKNDPHCPPPPNPQ
jgi:hypothetical protein